ncbi:MAG: DNA polymerase III subunit alpha [Alphaproteobacteria bacterium]|nr:DNA polymerase III subunit alpha [Alphaproteobacteria bacterium]
MPANFIHLRVHSAYSLAEGAIRIKEDAPKDGATPRPDVIGLCLKENMPAVAITDTGNLFGALEFAEAAVKAGIQPIIGCLVAVQRAEARGPALSSAVAAPVTDHLVLLVQNEVGYQNLCALISHSFLAEARMQPYVTFAELSEKSEGLIALTGGVTGPVGALFLQGQAKPAEEMLTQLMGIFPERLYIELQRHPESPQQAKEDALEPFLLQMADAYNIPLVATNDVFFGEPHQAEAHDALICVAEKTFVSDTHRRRLGPDYCFQSAAQMRALFADVPEACDNTLVIAQRCAYMPPVRKPILPAFPTAKGRTEAEELEAQAREGLALRLKKNDTSVDEKMYTDRLAFELDVINRMGFAGYFLIVSDFIRWAKKNNIPVGPGRGSGAGSLVAYVLQITDLDPLRWGLLFERFLNPDRVSMPDFDIDFCQERRDDVIGYVQQKYGADKVAQIITFGKLQARAVLRDVGRVLGMPYGYIDKISKLVPFNPANPVTLGQAIEVEPQLQTLRDNDPQVAQLLNIALQLEGLYRNASTHAAGVVIGDRPLQQLVPLYREPGGTLPATQFNLKTVEQAGLVKFDFLGLKTLDVLQQVVELLKAREISLDLSTLPLDDAPTYALLSKGDTTGVFQLESAGMRDVLRQMKPHTFTDIIALVALYRPGPMDNIPKYIKVKNGEEAPDYLHPLLEPMLRETAGIMIYQEQVMQAAQILAGYSLGQADVLRRAMGKKKADEMAAQRANFIQGAAGQGVDAEKAGHIFDQIDKFAGYGFNKSHAAAYALIAYQTAYVKANYPTEFHCAAMNFELNDTDKLNVYRGELQRHNIALLPPDINASQPLFSVAKTPAGQPAIRYGLAAIKGVGLAAMQQLVAVRGDQHFDTLADLAARLDPKMINRKQYEGLVMAGALDGLQPNRASALAAFDMLQQTVQSRQQNVQQNSLFGADEGGLPPITWPDVAPWDDLQALQHEFSALGFYLSAHPLESYRLLLQKLDVVPAAKAAEAIARSATTRVKLAGVVVAKQERTAKSGNRFAFVQLSDSKGGYEVTLFSEQLSAARDVLNAGQLILLDADVQLGSPNNPDDVRFIGRNVELLEKAVAKMAMGLRIDVGDISALPELQKTIAPLLAGKGRIQLVVAVDDKDIEIDLPQLYQISPALRHAVRRIAGVRDVQEV